MDYDLVVVGAGSAGGVVASRVSENPRIRVLLLEAGPDYPDAHDLPADLVNGNDNSYVNHDWGFSYTPSANAGSTSFPRGRVVGGSSAVNTCIALRGEPDDYEEWAKAAGPEWAWERCLPAFARLEADADFGREPYHGSDGPLPITRYAREQLTPIQAAFLDGCAELGLPSCPDHNAPGATGYGPTPLNKRGSRRISVAEAYLRPEVRARPNLTIRPGTLVRRVVVEGGRVRGLECVVSSGLERVECDEVVVSTGAISTPPLLVRSGIGPRRTLDELGIEAVRPSEGVGRLLDHPATMILLNSRDPVDGGAPLMQTCLRFGHRDPGDLFVEALSHTSRFIVQDTPVVAVAAAVYLSRGMGRVRVVSAEPDAAPAIEPRLLEEDADLDLLVEGVRMAAQIASTRAVGDVTEGFLAPLPEVVSDDVQLRQHIRMFCGSGYHPSGTAPMGHADDPMAVCDQYGRVHGVDGLRVADASIMPTCPRANTNIPTIMIGERFGEWLGAELGS